MDFKEYQQKTGDTAMYPKNEALNYLTLGLSGEAGEVAGKVKKIIRDKGGIVNPEDEKALAKELGDVMWYLAQLCTYLGADMGEVAQANIDKLASRAARGTLQGDGDDR